MKKNKVVNLETQLALIDDKIRRLEFRKNQIQKMITEMRSKQVINSSSATAKNFSEQSQSGSNTSETQKATSDTNALDTRVSTTSGLSVEKEAVV